MIVSPTLQTLLIGFTFLAVCTCIGYVIKPKIGLKKALLFFVILWLAYCVYHMSVGMRHGYTFLEELPFLVLNFGLPSLVAWFIFKQGKKPL